MITEEESVLTIKENDRLIAIVFNDLKSHHKIFYKVDEMGMDQIKELMEKYKI